MLFVRMHNRTIQFVRLFCSQVVDPSAALPRNPNGPIDQDESLLL